MKYKIVSVVILFVIILSLLPSTTIVLCNGASTHITIVQKNITIEYGDTLLPHLYVLKFNGQNGYVDIAEFDYGGNVSFTLMSYVNVFGSTGTYQRIGGRRNNIWLQTNAENTIIWGGFTDSTGSVNNALVDPALQFNSWVHATITYDWDTGVIRGYKDAQLTEEKSVGSKEIYIPVTPVRIGADDQGHYFYGYISYFLWYNYTLTNIEINDTYIKHIINANGLILFLEPTAFNGTHYLDLSGNNNHGTPYNGVELVEADEKWLWLVKGLHNDYKVHFKMFPLGTRIVFKDPITNNTRYEITINSTSYYESGIVPEHNATILPDTYDVYVYVPALGIAPVYKSVNGYVGGLVHIYVDVYGYSPFAYTSVDVEVVLFDHTNNVRDRVAVYDISLGDKKRVELTFYVTDQDIGTHTWKIAVGWYSADIWFACTNTTIIINIDPLDRKNILIDRYSDTDYILLYTDQNIEFNYTKYYKDMDTFAFFTDLVALAGDVDIVLNNGTTIENIIYYDASEGYYIYYTVDSYGYKEAYYTVNTSKITNIDFIICYDYTLFVLDGYVYAKFNASAKNMKIVFDITVPKIDERTPSVMVFLDNLFYNESNYYPAYTSGTIDFNKNNVSDAYEITEIDYWDILDCQVEVVYPDGSNDWILYDGLYALGLKRNLEFSGSENDVMIVSNFTYYVYNVSSNTIYYNNIGFWNYYRNNFEIEITIYYLDESYIARLEVDNKTINIPPVNELALRSFLSWYYQHSQYFKQGDVLMPSHSIDVNKYSKLPEWYDFMGWKDYIVSLFGDVFFFIRQMFSLFGSIMTFTLAIMPNLTSLFNYFILFIITAIITLAIYKPLMLYSLFIWLVEFTKKILEFLYNVIMKLVGVVAKIWDLITGPFT